MKSTWESETSIFEMIMKGTTIVMPCVWSRVGKEQTPSKDISIVIDKEMAIGEAVELVEAEALSFVKSHGADDIRHYFIESLSINGTTITLETGT